MRQSDEIIHQQHRLRIMAALEGEREPLDFATLKAISGATDGNLGAHLTTLEKAGYVSVTKEAVGKRNRTWVGITSLGKQAFRNHVTYLEHLLEASFTTGSRSS